MRNYNNQDGLKLQKQIFLPLSRVWLWTFAWWVWRPTAPLRSPPRRRAGRGARGVLGQSQTVQMKFECNKLLFARIVGKYFSNALRYLWFYGKFWKYQVRALMLEELTWIIMRNQMVRLESWYLTLYWEFNMGMVTLDSGLGKMKSWPDWTVR